MNLDRLVLRWAWVHALTNFSTPPFPTLAGNLVYDSKIEPAEDFKEDQILPLCVVYTDYDRYHWLHQSLNGRDRLLTVTLELLVAQIKELPGDEGFAVRFPNTDPELEASLDLFEMQVARAIRASNAAAECVRHFMPAIHDVISRRGATVEGGQKLAARQITIEAKVPRGPAKGVVAPHVAAFLDKLEEYDDYKPMIAEVRAAYTADAGLTSAEQMISAMGWTTKTGQMLGYESGPAVLLPPNIQWLGPSGSPLP
jgi:hypothetical protein